MLQSGRARQLWLATSLVLATLVASVSASARTLEVRDEAHVLGAQDVAHLRAEVASAPFDARLLVSTDHPDSQDFARYAEKSVSEPNMVLVGLDPEHHHVQVRFGTGSRVPQDARGAIERSGNEAFRQGAWETGVATIFRTAAEAVSIQPAQEPTGVQPQAAPTPAGPSLILMVIGGFVAIAVVASLLFRKRGMGAAQYGPGYGPPPYGGGGYGYGPGGMGQGGGMGPLGGGLLGAGLGGLAGYEIGKLEGEREERGRDFGGGGTDANVGGDSGGSFDDGGGGGSDWGGGDGGGGDSGGGGGDF